MIILKLEVTTQEFWEVVEAMKQDFIKMKDINKYNNRSYSILEAFLVEGLPKLSAILVKSYITGKIDDLEKLKDIVYHTSRVIEGDILLSINLHVSTLLELTITLAKESREQKSYNALVQLIDKTIAEGVGLLTKMELKNAVDKFSSMEDVISL